jgi:hypothetical protein
VDPLWDAVFSAPLGDEESEREEGFDVLPKFNDYRWTFESAEGRLVGEAGYPTLHVGIRIVAGPKATANRVVFDDLFLVPFPRKGETQDAATARMRRTMTRLRNHLKLAQERPLGRPGDVDAIGAWGRQFIGKEVIGALRVEGAREETDRDTGEKTGRVFDARNRIIWDSIADPAAFVIDKTTGRATAQTYGDRSAMAIAEADAKAASGGGAAGKRAGTAFGSPTPTSFFPGGGGSGT